jgi:(E)-4-hydroxy-3-methylbut-2-enyl-diphosphate synthase
VIKQKKTKIVRIGGKKIGGTNPVLVQSMANTKTENLKSTIRQIYQLEKAGCEIVRVAVHSLEAARNLKQIKKEISIPLVADIQFNYQWAIESAKCGADKIRINPGNIGSKEKLGR